MGEGGGADHPLSPSPQFISRIWAIFPFPCPLIHSRCNESSDQIAVNPHHLDLSGTLHLSLRVLIKYKNSTITMMVYCFIFWVSKLKLSSQSVSHSRLFHRTLILIYFHTFPVKNPSSTSALIQSIHPLNPELVHPPKYSNFPLLKLLFDKMHLLPLPLPPPQLKDSAPSHP